ncbi:SDR family oxidoreductase [Lichenicola sp.]|uniref:SDR family oxidoreductase n=1 Tax=Lichenicola sp. TaxID=2804529 RepID=UPI003B0084EA
MSTRPTVLVGAGGMLGSAFRRNMLPDPVCLGRDQLDVSQPGVLVDRIASLGPSLVINCAADTDVERAESDPGPAYAANALLPELLAQACRKAGSRLVHFSSTGCYGDWKRTPYSDWDPLRPTTAHHASKAAGEAAVREAWPDSLILRLGWLYGGDPGHRKNFVWARMNEARSAPEMFSDPHQTGTPTWVGDIVAQTLRILDAGLSGTYNCVAGGAVTRFDYVQRILELAGHDTRLRPRRFERKAPVSPNEAAVNTKLGLLHLDIMPRWDEALARYVASLAAAA